MTTIETVINGRLQVVKRSLTRHRLVFVQCGAAFQPIKDELLGRLGATVVLASDLLDAEHPELSPAVVVVGLEQIGNLHPVPTGNRLGALRERVLTLVDEGKSVCLVSSAPRISYGNVPGSSLLEDAALALMPPLTDAECPSDARRRAGWRLPAIAFGNDVDSAACLTAILGELGTGVLSALDHCLFEIDPRSSAGLGFLTDREVEAVRGTGLLTVNPAGECELVDQRLLGSLKEALSALLGAATMPPISLSSVSNGLWYIERTIRSALRREASRANGRNWRTQTIPGGLAVEVLKRARSDTSLAAASVAELRDPLEWLTLGELLDLVTSNKHGGLGVDRLIWRRFSEQVVPVRNRLSHMRLLKSSDEEVVSTWVRLIRQQLE
jgi:hypothetical protein